MWSLAVFWFLLVPLIIVMLVTYAKSKRLYRLLYILSVFTYAMTVMYTIDAFSLGRNAIVAMLSFSSVLMILVGWTYHKSTKKKRK